MNDEPNCDDCERRYGNMVSRYDYRIDELDVLVKDQDLIIRFLLNWIRKGVTDNVGKGN